MCRKWLTIWDKIIFAKISPKWDSIGAFRDKARMDLPEWDKIT